MPEHCPGVLISSAVVDSRYQDNFNVKSLGWIAWKYGECSQLGNKKNQVEGLVI